MSKPRGVEFGRMFAPVHEDLTKRMDVAFVEDVDVLRLGVRRYLDDPKWIWCRPGDAHRQAMELRIVDFLPRRKDRFRGGRHQRFERTRSEPAFTLDILNRTSTNPEAGEIDDAVR